MPDKHEHLIDLLRDVNREIGKHIHYVAANHGIPLPFLRITRQIAAEPGITVSELARKTGMVKSHVSNMIREMELRGWVEKQPDPADQRLIRLTVTSVTEREMAVIRQEIRHKLNELVADVPGSTADMLIVGLREVQAAIRQYDSQTAHPAEKRQA